MELRRFRCFFFHASNTVENYPINHLLREIGSLGHFGVEVFFTISGFIIFYSMSKAGYKLGKDTWTFYLKRLIRVEPAYIASIFFTISLGLVANQIYQKPLYEYTWQQVASHFFYLSNFLGYEWVNPVYWTLAIEFQFYLFLSLIYPLLFNRKWQGLTILVLILLSSANASVTQGTVIDFIPYFLMGIITAFKKLGSIKRNEYLGLMLICALSVVYKFGFIPCSVVLIAAPFLAASGFKKIYQPIKFLGLTSYSIYLIHYPIVEKSVRFGKILGASITAQIAVLFFSVAISIMVAWCTYILIEKPSLNAANSINYKA